MLGIHTSRPTGRAYSCRETRVSPCPKTYRRPLAMIQHPGTTPLSWGAGSPPHNRLNRPSQVTTSPRPNGPIATDAAWQVINSIRVLAMDAVQAADSGHPGTPMALAPVGYLLWRRHLKHAPQ